MANKPSFYRDRHSIWRKTAQIISDRAGFIQEEDRIDLFYPKTEPYKPLFHPV